MKKSMFNMEKGTKFWIGILIFVFSLIYALFSLGKIEVLQWFTVVWSIFLIIFLSIEGAIFTYFKRGGYKKIGLGDFIIWITMVTVGALIINTVALITIIGQEAPNWINSFATTTGVTVGIVSAILAVVYVFIPKPN